MDLGNRPRRLAGRQKEILEIVIEEFIKSARPVGSEFLAENYEFVPLRGISRRERISPATIRNDLAGLEELGFLEKPHPSGGRVPTANGWHYFVEEIWEPSYLSEEEVLKFRRLMSNLIGLSLELRDCISHFFPEVSDEFLKKFLMDKLFKNYDRRK